jgi:hypothetical protein
MDRYSKVVLTIIATALVYLCVIFTPLPSVSAQTAKRPGDPTGPAETVIVGFRLQPGDSLPVSVPRPLPVSIADTVRVNGSVTTSQESDHPDRVSIVGWETGAAFKKPGDFRRLDIKNGLPVSTIPQ